MAGLETKLNDLLDKVVDEYKKKWLIIKYKNTECTVVGKICVLFIEEWRSNVYRNLNYLGSVELWRRVETATAY